MTEMKSDQEQPSSQELVLETQHACFGGKVAFYHHTSESCRSNMQFSVFIPPQAKEGLVPVLYYLSGLTCTAENFTTKAGAQRYAAESGIMLVAPDTSPRNTGVPGENDSDDLGSGAGFYVDATAAPWSSHYRMYSYVTRELPRLIHTYFPANPDRQGIFGHSMGGTRSTGLRPTQPQPLPIDLSLRPRHRTYPMSKVGAGLYSLSG